MFYKTSKLSVCASEDSLKRRDFFLERLLPTNLNLLRLYVSKDRIIIFLFEN